ncbi:MAG: TonB-dependent receptor [Bacteroidetes bacterium]|jgi:iron complex outermembrane receptor protein|nr:TonB-dependent receptor [Bacteroidota bacterium]
MNQMNELNHTRVCFKKWSRKSYAVFNSLKKEIKIGALLASYSLLSPLGNAQEQADTFYMPREYDLDEVVISADLVPQTFDEQSKIVTSITAQQISASPAPGIPSLLENHSSIDVRQRGVHGVQSDLSIRGGDHNQSLILLNSNPINNPQTGHHNLNLPLDFLSLTKIEILQGPGGRIWGAGAFTGAVNFISRPNAENRIEAIAEYGQHNLLKSGLNINKVFNNSAHNLGFSYSQSDGYISNTDFQAANLLYTGLYTFESSSVLVTLGYHKKDFGAQSFYSTSYPEQHEITEGINASVNYETGKTIKFSSNTYFNLHKDRFELFREGDGYYKRKNGFFVKGNDTATFSPSQPSLFPYTGHNYHLTNSFGNRSKLIIPTPIGKFIAGAGHKIDKVFSNVLGQPSDSIKVKNAVDAYYDKAQTRATQNTFLNYLNTFGRFTISAGVLTHWNSDENLKLSWYPGIDLSFNIVPAFKIFTSVNQSLRHPTYTELYYYDGVSQGNTDLKPEKANSYEIGLTYQNEFLTLSQVGFFQQESNSIEFLSEDDTNTTVQYVARNISQFERLGIAFDGVLKTPFLPVLESFQVGYSYMEITHNTAQYDARYSLDHLKHKLNVLLSHKIIAPVTVQWHIQYQDRLGRYMEVLEDGSSRESAYPAFLLTNVYAYYQFKRAKLFLKVNNLFDVDYIDFGNIRQPGRWISGGIKLDIYY